MIRTRSALARCTALTSAALAVTLATPGHAQEAFDLEAITVTANREATAIERSGSTVEVVEEEEIRAAGEVRLSEFLNRLPGVSVSGNGPAGTSSTLRIRGLNGKYVPVYIDGIDVTDTAGVGVQFDWATLMTSDICRVEVLKGSQSALYGSEAIGGVINLTSNCADGPGLTQRYALELGSYDTLKLSYGASYMGQRGGMTASIARVTSDGFSAADENDGNTEDDGFEAIRLSFSGEYDLTDDLTIGAAGFWQKSESEFDGFVEIATDVYDLMDTPDHGDREELGLRLFARLDRNAIEHEFALQYYGIDRTSVSGGWPSEFEGRRKGLSYLGQTSAAPDLDVAFGADYTKETFETGAGDGSNDTASLFFEGNWTPSEDLSLVASLRQDHHSDFGGNTTGRLALAWSPREDLILRASAGTGFRAPSLYELYAGNEVGNPDLTPETSVSYELGIEKTFTADGFLRATLFQTEINDLIDFVYDPSRTFDGYYDQIPGTTEVRGLELSGGVALTQGLRLEGNYTYTDTETADGTRLNRVPEHDISLGLAATLSDQLSGRLDLRRAVDTLEFGTPLPDYTVVDVSLSYDVAADTTAYVRIENLFDEQYQTSRGYGTSDRAFYFGLRGSF